MHCAASLHVAGAERVECVVIGAGVVGLACARALARAGREVIVLERHGQIGTETSSRNSEVIHAGIYYEPGSLKARLCVRGNALLYAHCKNYGVPFRRCGKIIVATDPAQFETLRVYQQRAVANGIDELRWLQPTEVAELEPAVRCVGAVMSESTGIIDSHAFMESLVGDLEAHGGVVAFHSEVVGGRPAHGRILIETEQLTLDAEFVVNSTGLDAPGLARRLAEYPSAEMPNAYYAKGQYYTLDGSIAVSPTRLSGGGGGRAWRARHARSRGPGALRSRRHLDRRQSTIASMSAIANASSLRSVATTRTSMSVGCTRVTRGYGRKSPPPANPLRIFSCWDRETMGSTG